MWSTQSHSRSLTVNYLLINCLSDRDEWYQKQCRFPIDEGTWPRASKLRWPSSHHAEASLKAHQCSKHQGLSERYGRSCGAQNLSLDSCASVEVHRGAKKVWGWAMSFCHQKILSQFRFNSANVPEIHWRVSKIRDPQQMFSCCLSL